MSSSDPKLKSKQTSTTEPPDAELARRIRQSDERAFKLLYQRYYEPLFRFVWRRVQNDEASKDLLQTLFIRIWQARERLDADQVIKAYLYQIATNLVVDHFRQKGRAHAIWEEGAGFEPSAGPDNRFELEEAIHLAIQQLPEALRTVYLLSRVKHKKNAEIARELDISIKTVESRLTKAFVILREQLKPLLLLVLVVGYWKLVNG